MTGAEPTPLEISRGGVTERTELRTTHEEADVIVVQQAIHLASLDKQSIHIVANDTDIFTPLLHYYKAQNLTCNLVMIATSTSRTSVDIKAIAEKNLETMGQRETQLDDVIAECTLHAAMVSLRSM